VANTYLGSPDIGLISLPDIVGHTAAIINAVDIPLIVDADTGFGNAVNVWHTVRSLERAGASAIQLEDQNSPKRCGHFADKSVLSMEEMVLKISAACAARQDEDTVIIARTDALAEHGVEAACNRANAYRAAGADILFVEGPRTEDEIAFIAREVEGPQILNLVEGGRTPIISPQTIEELGFAIALYANLTLLAAIESMTSVLNHLQIRADPAQRPKIATWEQRQNIVRKPFFDALGSRYSTSTNTRTQNTNSEPAHSH
jgi:2-methylisocitrate lyase-like PEP mutase family enzyme